MEFIMVDSNIQKAKDILVKGNYTCVIIKSGMEYKSMERGVKPLLDCLETRGDFEGAYVADKVVGKAAAFLYVLMKVKEIHATVLSKPAYDVLCSNDIIVTYNEMVPAIKNRDNTGFCPMESAVLAINEPNQAHAKIVETREKLLFVNR